MLIALNSSRNPRKHLAHNINKDMQVDHHALTSDYYSSFQSNVRMERLGNWKFYGESIF